MIKATISEAKTQLSELVKWAQRGEKVVLTTGRKKTPVAEIVALKSGKNGPLISFTCRASPYRLTSTSFPRPN